MALAIIMINYSLQYIYQVLYSLRYETTGYDLKAYTVKKTYDQ